MNEAEIKKIKKEIIDASYAVGEGHIASAFSILDIMYVLTNNVMCFQKESLATDENDYLVVSKGHAAIGLYAILADKGFFSKTELKTFGKFDSRLGGHPDRNKVPGVCVSTGSLGHGLPNAVGLAYGLKLRGLTSKVYVIVGDGELNEGSMWEAILLAPQLKLDNICCIVDNNRSIERALALNSVEKKFSAFNWETAVVDGHDHEELRKVLSKKCGKPYAVIAETIKGQGCKMMEENPQLWHHKSPTEEEYRVLMEELSL